MNEDFYYIEKWCPPSKQKLHEHNGYWLCFGVGYKWSLPKCLLEAEKCRAQNPRRKLRIVHQVMTRTEWRDRKKLK
jgi:hypothetical protein